MLAKFDLLVDVECVAVEVIIDSSPLFHRNTVTRGVYGPGHEREVVGGGKESFPSVVFLQTTVRA